MFRWDWKRILRKDLLTSFSTGKIGNSCRKPFSSVFWTFRIGICCWIGNTYWNICVYCLLCGTKISQYSRLRLTQSGWAGKLFHLTRIDHDELRVQFVHRYTSSKNTMTTIPCSSYCMMNHASQDLILHKKRNVPQHWLIDVNKQRIYILAIIIIIKEHLHYTQQKLPVNSSVTKR